MGWWGVVLETERLEGFLRGPASGLGVPGGERDVAVGDGVEGLLRGSSFRASSLVLWGCGGMSEAVWSSRASLWGWGMCWPKKRLKSLRGPCLDDEDEESGIEEKEGRRIKRNREEACSGTASIS